MSSRPTPEVWQKFAKVDRMVDVYQKENGKFKKDSNGKKIRIGSKSIVKGKCNKCGTEICRNANSLSNHYAKCVKYGVFDAAGYLISRKSNNNNLNDSNQNNDSNLLNFDIDGIDDMTPPEYKHFKQLLITSFSSTGGVWTQQQQRLVEKLFGLWQVDKAIKFEHLNSIYFKLIMKICCPKLKIPQKHLLKSKILPKIKDDFKQIGDSKIKEAQTASLSVDGSNDKQEGLVHVVALLPDPVLVLQKRSKWEPENAERIYGHCVEGKQYLQKLACKDTQLISDNCSTQKAVARKWKKEQKTGAPGCGTHGFNLINGKIAQRTKNKEQLKKAKKLQARLIKSKLGQFVNKYKMESDIKYKIQKEHSITDTTDPNYIIYFNKYKKSYNKRNGFTKTPATREWNHSTKLLKKQLKDSKFIKRTTDSDQLPFTKNYLKKTIKSKVNIKEIIQSDKFWADSAKFVEKYAEITNTLDRLQGNSNLSDVQYQYQRIFDLYNDEDYKFYDEGVAGFIADKWQLIKDDIHFAARYADPRRVNEPYKSRQYNKAIAYYKIHLPQWDNKWSDIFDEFTNSLGRFKNKKKLNMKDHNMNHCIVYWKHFEKFEELKDFAIFMGGLNKSTGTNCDIERSFNPLKKYQTASNSSIGPITLDLLMYCGVNMMFFGHQTILDYYGIPRDMYQNRKYTKRSNKQVIEQVDSNSDQEYDSDVYDDESYYTSMSESDDSDTDSDDDDDSNSNSDDGDDMSVSE